MRMSYRHLIRFSSVLLGPVHFVTRRICLGVPSQSEWPMKMDFCSGRQAPVCTPIEESIGATR